MVGDNPECLDEVRLCMSKKWPVIVLSGSDLCNKIKGLKGSEEVDDVLGDIPKYGSLYCIEENSEDLASIAHLGLAVSL